MSSFNKSSRQLAIGAALTILACQVGLATLTQGPDPSQREISLYHYLQDGQAQLIAPLHLTAKQKTDFDNLLKTAAHNRVARAQDPFGDFYDSLKSVLTKEQFTAYIQATCKPDAIRTGHAAVKGDQISQEFTVSYSAFATPKITFQWQQALQTGPNPKYVGPDGAAKSYWTETDHTVTAAPGPISVRVRGLYGQTASPWTYQTAVLSVHSPDQHLANNNARALATAVQGRAVVKGAYDANLTDYAADLGGTIPINPCTGTPTGYAITPKPTTPPTATVTATPGTKCGPWTPTPYNLSL